MIYKATGINIIYFSQLAKEKENLLLVKNFVTWLELRHKFKIKVIWSNNKINYIKIKA